MILPVTLWRQDALLQHTIDEQLAFGLYYAFLLAMAAYNLFLFSALRDLVYLKYVGYVFGFVLFQASLNGHAFMYLWPASPVFGDVASTAWFSFSLACVLPFLRRMTNTAVLAPKLHRIMGALSLIWAALVPVSIWWYFVGVRVATTLAALTVVVLPVPMVLAVRRGFRPARYVTLGYAAILPGAVVLALRMLDVIPATFWTEHVVKFGTAVEALLLSFALADRINLLSREKAAVQSSLIRAQREFSEKLLTVQDGERRRIAAELHDGVGQLLLVIASKLKRLARGVRPELRESSDALVELAQAAVAEIRGVAHDLYPHQLDRLGLVTSLRQIAKQTLEPGGIGWSCALQELDGVLPKDTEIHVFRIIQEALSNVVRHSSAGHVEIAAKSLAGQVRITVEDDGVGPRGEPGFGLVSMQQRARSIGGDLSLRSGESGGSVLELLIPWEEWK